MARYSRGVTHVEFDFDGGSCLRVLQRAALIAGCVFGEEALAGELATGAVDKLVFVDANPERPMPDIDVTVFDHHSIEGSAANEEQPGTTAFDILVDRIGTCGLDPDQLARWRELVRSGDKKAVPDDMDVTRALKRAHAYFESDSETYSKWFVPLFDGFFANSPDLDRAVNVLYQGTDKFLCDNPDSPARPMLRRWMARLSDRDRLLRSLESTPRNLLNYLAYLDEDVARDCTWHCLEGYHKDQTEFHKCKDDFMKANIDLFGDTLVISSITTSRKFPQVARYMILNEAERRRLTPVIQERVTNRGDTWYIMIIHPRYKNFQIFINGSQRAIHEMSLEIVKAIRAEILLKRGLSVPDRAMLSVGGTIAGTKPLFYNKDVSYQSILWGSIKHPQKDPAVEFGSTSTQIHSRLIDILKLGLDKEQYAAGCDPASCGGCQIYDWRLSKCDARRAAL